MLTDFINSEKLDAEIIIVNDGGNDSTADIVNKMSLQNTAIKFIDRKENKGKGYSVREGMRATKGNTIIFTDADLPYGTRHFNQFIAPLRSNETDLVIANRNKKENPQNIEMGTLRKLTHWGFPFFVRHLLKINFSDTQAGLKGIKKEAVIKLLPKLSVDRFAFDLELLVAAQNAGLKILEIPVSLENIGKSHINILRDSLQMLKDIFKIWWKFKK